VTVTSMLPIIPIAVTSRRGTAPCKEERVTNLATEGIVRRHAEVSAVMHAQLPRLVDGHADIWDRSFAPKRCHVRGPLAMRGLVVFLRHRFGDWRGLRRRRVVTGVRARDDGEPHSVSQPLNDVHTTRHSWHHRRALLYIDAVA
jgi:hypothetical protein